MPYSELIHLLKQLYGVVPARCLAKCADGCIVPWWRDPLHPGTNCANLKKFIQFLGRPIEHFRSQHSIKAYGCKSSRYMMRLGALLRFPWVPWFMISSRSKADCQADPVSQDFLDLLIDSPGSQTYSLQGGAPKIAKLVYNSNNYGL